MSEFEYLAAFVAYRDGLVEPDVLRAALDGSTVSGDEFLARLSRLGVDEAICDEILARAQRLHGAPSTDDGPPRYTHERTYSSGGMGRILIVHDTVIERDVALKELLPEHLASSDGHDSGPSVVDRFVREAKVTGQLEHPGIVPLYELGQRPDGTRYYTMKFVRGRSFSDAINEATSLEARLGLLTHFVDICQALAYAHDRGVIHRDMKPSNVLVGSFGETVVIDWGLAKLKNADASNSSREETIVTSRVRTAEADSNPGSKTEYGQVMGTPEYMAPEQALGQLDSVDERSDVYSLGVILYKLLTGKTPFDGETVQELLNSVVNDDPVPPTQLNAAVPRELEAVCLRAIEKVPDDRFQTAKDMADEINRYLTGALVTAYEYGVTDLFRRFVRRYRVHLGAAAAAVLFAVVSAGAAYRNVLHANDRERVQRLRAERVHYTSSVQLAASRLDDGLVSLARQALANAPPSERNWEWGYLVREAFPSYNVQDENDPVPQAGEQPPAELWDAASVVHSVQHIDAHNGSVITAEFSRDGTRLCTASLDNTAKVWDARTGEIIREFNSSGGPMLGAQLSRDGKRLLTLEWDRAQIWDVETGRLLVTCTADSLPSSSRCWFSPDERRVVTSHVDGSVRIWDASTGALVHVLQGHSAIVLSVGFDAAGNLATAAQEPEIRVWNTESGAEIDRIEDIQGSGALVSPDFRYYAAGASPRGLRMWDRATRTELPWEPIELRGDIRAFSFSDDGSIFVTGDLSGDIHVFRTEDGKILASLTGSGSSFQYVSLSSDSTQLVTTGNDGSVDIWSPHAIPDTGPVEELIGHQSGSFIVFAAYNDDGTRIVSAGHDKSVIVWDADSGAMLRRHTGHEVEPRFAEFVPGGSRVVSVDWAGNVHVWSVETGEVLVRIEHDPAILLSAGAVHGGPHGTLRWLGPRMESIVSPEGQRVIVHDGIVMRVHDLDDGTVLCTLEDSRQWGVALPSFSPDGRFITSNAFLSNRTCVWDAATGRVVATLGGHQGPVTMASFDPTSTKVLTASLDRAARLFDAQSGELVFEFPGHTVFVLGARFDKSGGRIASFSADGTARTWHAESGRSWSVLAGHTFTVNGAVFSPDGTRVLTVSEDASIRVWNEAGEELVSITSEDALPAHAVWSPSGREILSAWSDGILRIDRALDWNRLDRAYDGETDLANDLETVERTKVHLPADESR